MKRKKLQEEEETIEEISLNAEMKLIELDSVISLTKDLLNKKYVEPNEVRQMPSVILPRLEFPAFSGDLFSWQEFWDRFKNATHDKTNISEVDKMNYLKSKLIGQAATVISGLALTEANYEATINLLKESYGREEFIINAHYKEMVNLQFIYIREFYDNTEIHIRSLEALKENIDSQLLVAVITSKLPGDVMTNLTERKGTEGLWTVKSLREKLKDYVAAREYSLAVTHSQHVPENKIMSTMEILVASSKSISNKPIVKRCVYCEEDHYTDDCRKYSTVDEKINKFVGTAFLV